MIVAVTGAAGFIGSHVVEGLIRRDVEVLAVDDFIAGDLANLARFALIDLIDSRRLLRLLERGDDPTPDAIVHLGAITDTTCDDQRLLARVNVKTSVRLARAARAAGIPFVYASSASVYGVVPGCEESPTYEAPCNPYAASKLLVDNTLRPLMASSTDGDPTLVGLRFFNVYGTREAHKGSMASIVHQAVEAIGRDEPVRLFARCPDAPDGTITRDWICVDDVVDVVLSFVFGPNRAGILNVGTGRSTTFEHVVGLVIASLGRGTIEPIDFRDSLRGRYQYRTVASLDALRRAGFEGDLSTVDDAVPRVVAEILSGSTHDG